MAALSKPPHGLHDEMMVDIQFMLLLLLFTSIAMAIAMALAWWQFGREQHLLFWTGSYSAAAFQWLANMGAISLKSDFLLYLTGVGIITSVTLAYAGVRSRAGHLCPLSVPAKVGSAFTLACGAVGAVLDANILVAFLMPVYAAVIMVLSAIAMAQQQRKMRGSEYGYMWTLVAFALYECVIIAVGFLAATTRDENWLLTYRLILGWGLPPLFILSGISAILMVAGDLAERLFHLSLTDPLTQLFNRRGLDDASERAIAAARRHGQKITVAMCDLDGFKALNDRFGHAAGDVALQCFASGLQRGLRRNDIVARLGGDEFVLVLTNSGAAQAGATIDRITAEIEKLSLVCAPGAKLGCSFGLTELSSSDKNIHEAIARADAALYQSKNEGKGRVSIG